MPTKASKGAVNDDFNIDLPNDPDVTDARNTPTEPMPDNFFASIEEDRDEAPNTFDLVEQRMEGNDEPTKDESEPAEEDEEPVEDSETDEDEDAEEDSEEIEASEQEDSEKKKGKSRNQRHKDRLQREVNAREVAEEKLQRLQKLEPVMNFILQDEELVQAVRNKRAGKPIAAQAEGADELTLPKKPERPARPVNFSRERAIDDPKSPDAIYLDAREEYLDAREDWQDETDRVLELKADREAAQQEVRQQEKSQQDWYDNLATGLNEAAQKDKSVSPEDIPGAIAEVMQVLGNPESYSPQFLWKFARQSIGTSEVVEKTKKTRNSSKKQTVKRQPAPASSEGTSTIYPKGWKNTDDQTADEREAAYLSL